MNSPLHTSPSRWFGLSLLGLAAAYAIPTLVYPAIADPTLVYGQPNPSAEEHVAQSGHVVIPADAEPLELVDAGPAVAFRKGDHVWLRTTSQAGSVNLPRFAAPVRSLRWLSGGKPAVSQEAAEIKLSPEPDTWLLQFSVSVPPDSVLEIELDAPAKLMDELKPLQPAGDGSFWLAAHAAKTFGSKLRYEPQTFKNTVGYWTQSEDFAEWTLELDRPGRFRVGVLQGCGQGHGGSRGRIALRAATSNAAAAENEEAPDETTSLDFEVEETGHFQNFRWRDLGEMELSQAGTYVLKLSPVEIRKAALMDVRAIHLVRMP